MSSPVDGFSFGLAGAGWAPGNERLSLLKQ